LIALAERGAATQEEIEAEHAKDKTTPGNIAYETCISSLPNSEAKSYAFNKVMDASTLTSIRTALIAGFQRPIQRHLLEPFVDLYFAHLISEWNAKSYEGAAKFVTGMYPSWIITQETLDKTNAWLNGEGKDSPAVLRKLLKDSQDGVIRALKVQKIDS
jgi:aminopeptidase N